MKKTARWLRKTRKNAAKMHKFWVKRGKHGLWHRRDLNWSWRGTAGR